jgi:YHS domain-containing protein
VPQDLLTRIVREPGKTMAVDPVCKMTVDEKTAKLKSDYKGTTYYFCAPGCKKAFDENPAKYLRPESQHKTGCGCGCR